MDREAVIRCAKDCDIVYNFAGLADINDAKDKPELTAQLNILGHIHTLEAAKACNARRFVYASTVYVYSESGSFYRASKQAGEKFVELYQEKYKLPFTILRYGSLYGRRSDSRNAIHRFIEGALDKNEIRYLGTGEELREYVHVADAAIASVDVLTEQFANQHIVVTGHQQLRIRDVLAMISEMLPQNKVKIVYDKMDVEAHYNITPYTYRPRLGKKLVVNPFIDMGQGLLDCIHEIDEKLRTV